jgi:hypothetical protein
MALSGKQSPLGINTLGGLLRNQGISINPVAQEYYGSSKTNNNYTPGSLINDTCLKSLTNAINDAFVRGQPGSVGVMSNSYIDGTTLIVGNLTSGYIQVGMSLTGTGVTAGTTIVSNIQGEGTLSKWNVSISQSVKDVTITGTMPSYTVNNTVYTNLISIGQATIPGLGNSKPPTYTDEDPSNTWSGQATNGYAIPGNTGQGQSAKWQDWNATAVNVSATQWGFLRLLALQAYNEFNYNGNPEKLNDPTYSVPLKNVAQTMLGYNAFQNQSNQVINALYQSQEFADGTYSNMNDMITSDITGVSLSAKAFGQDLINLGRALNLAKISNFGLPSSLLQVMQQNAAVSPAVTIALISSGMTQEELNSILLTGAATPEQEKRIYNSFTIVDGQELMEVLQVMRVTTKGITVLSDLLDVKKLFPLSRNTLTVPIYNTAPGPTNSKTYYFLFKNDNMNPQLRAPNVESQIPIITSYPELDDSVTPSYPVTPNDVVIQEERQAIVNATPSVLPQVRGTLDDYYRNQN